VKWQRKSAKKIRKKGRKKSIQYSNNTVKVINGFLKNSIFSKKHCQFNNKNRGNKPKKKLFWGDLNYRKLSKIIDNDSRNYRYR
jgi:hypothetical protein